jgi:DtxR family transcriptional regulator, Mn-dependent transcriptional regulator
MPSTHHSLPTRTADCLKLCYKFQERGQRISTSAMRERLQILEPTGQLSDATVTQLFKELDDLGYVHHTPYRGVELTPRGALLAATFVRRHRLLELFLVKQMGFDLDAVDAEAERMEHAVSDEFVDRMDALLGHPTEDPHGDPIPSKVGEVITPPMRRLSDLIPGQQAVVRRVSDAKRDVLHYLGMLGLLPGARVTMRERAPFGGPLRIHVGDPTNGQEHAIGPQLADEVGVVVMETIEAGTGAQ